MPLAVTILTPVAPVTDADPLVVPPALEAALVTAVLPLFGLGLLPLLVEPPELSTVP